MRLPTPPSCLCGCKGDLNPGRRFLSGHDKRTDGRLKRLAVGIQPRDGDELVLSDDLIDFYEQYPNFRVVGDWYAHHVLNLVVRGSTPRQIPDERR